MAIRNSSTDGGGFFVRHTYFTGADEPYEKLKHALLANISEAARHSIYSPVSLQRGSVKGV